MDYSRIRLLLEKFWECETTPQEEEELRHFYNYSQQLPDDLAEFKELFVYQEKERQIRLDPGFDQRIWKAIQGERQILKRGGGHWIKVAAVLLLFLGVYQVFVEVRKSESDTYQTPEQALAEVRQALNFVSSKMNRGQQLVEKNMDEMKLINQYIK